MLSKEKKCLIAYFSRSGMNYVAGKIVDLPVGNTRRVAEMIAEKTGGTLYEIAAKEPYPADYRACTVAARDEKAADARPELAEKVPDIKNFDAVFLGYPNWCGTCPMPVLTFLESANFSGKTIYPFCTNEGSGLGTSLDDIHKAVPEAKIRLGLSIRGSAAAEAGEEIDGWLYVM